MKTIFLIGDSIRFNKKGGYGWKVARRFEGEANVLQPDDNCRYTTYTLRCIRDWFGKLEPNSIDLIHWNNGLWDIVKMDGDEENLIPAEIYKANLVRIYNKLKHFQPNAKIIFAFSTAVVEEEFGPNFIRTNAEIRKYNQIAYETLAPLGVAFDDLYSLTETFPRNLHLDKTHFTEEGGELIADRVEECIRKNLE